MNDLEFEYALRTHVARAKAKLCAYDHTLENCTISFDADGVDRSQWNIRKYISYGPDIQVGGANLMRVVDDVIYLYGAHETNKELRLLPSPANPDNTLEENVNAGITAKVPSDDILF